MSIIRITKKFGAVLSGHQKLRIAELAVLMVIGGLLEMCSVSLVLPFIDVVMNPDATMEKWYVQIVCRIFDLHASRTFLVFMAIVLAGVYILKNLYLMFEFNIQYRFVYGNMRRMQSRILEVIIHRPYEFFLQASSAEVMRIIGSDTAGAFNLLITLLNILTELVVSGMLIVTVFIITPLVTLCIAAVMLVLLLLINQVIKPKLREAGLAQQRASTGMGKWLIQSIHGIKEVKIMGKEDYFRDNYDTYGWMSVNAQRKNQILGTMPRFLIEAVSMSTMFVVVAIVIYRGAELETIVPMLSAVAMAALRLMPSVNRIAGGLAQIAYTEPALDKLIENLKTIDGVNDAPQEALPDSTPDKQPEARIALLKRNISFQNISFRYPDAENEVLTDAAMTIQRGESVGIVGASGAGKTTAADILLGLLKPQKGQVLIDGVDITEDIRGWHDQIGYIPQMIFMLDDTIRNNVCFGERAEDISDEQVWRALEEASLANFVKSLPKGIDTEIGERGIRLSGGQRQRIGIARALYRDPAVLVFDEATSALDNETEAEIMESIRHLQGQKTMVIIAHRLTTIESCDHVYRVADGRIVQER